jgi:hypothetical protein
MHDPVIRRPVTSIPRSDENYTASRSELQARMTSLLAPAVLIQNARIYVAHIVKDGTVAAALF